MKSFSEFLREDYLNEDVGAIATAHGFKKKTERSTPHPVTGKTVPRHYYEHPNTGERISALGPTKNEFGHSRKDGSTITAFKPASDLASHLQKRGYKVNEDYLNEGAHDYITSVHSDKEGDVSKHWDHVKKEDSARNGHQDGYSGDSQTFDRGIDFHRHVTHPNREAAHKYILDKHEKWGKPIAVKYKHTDGKIHHAVGGWAAS